MKRPLRLKCAGRVQASTRMKRSATCYWSSTLSCPCCGNGRMAKVQGARDDSNGEKAQHWKRNCTYKRICYIMGGGGGGKEIEGQFNMRSVARASGADCRPCMVSVNRVLCRLGTASFLICRQMGAPTGCLTSMYGVWAVKPLPWRARGPRNRGAWPFSMWAWSTGRALTVCMICRRALKRRRNQLGRCRFRLRRAVQHKD